MGRRAARSQRLQLPLLFDMLQATPQKTAIHGLAAHFSRRMLERYSHIRMAAKREAAGAISLQLAPRISEGSPTISPTAGGSLENYRQRVQVLCA
jgi:hypothetical protein